MGLDMYLEKRLHFNRWDNKDHQLIIAHPEHKIPPNSVINIECHVMYWRKANAIHRWFVQNVQDGDDDCEEHWVTKENLQLLLSTIEKALNSEYPETILPTQSGFFFGSTDYDAYYTDDLIETENVLTKELAEWEDGWEYYYRSSW